jgi:serine/threonine-protein kinase
MPDSEPATDSIVGRVLAGRYRIDAFLGAGGMGAVYRAQHVHMRKAVAVKILHREMTSMPEVVARFEREAVAAARIEHPNVATATDFGRLEDGSFYLVLEFVEGQGLAAVLKAEGSLPEARVLRIGRQIADALAAAHAAGIVHRDLKPDNVMLIEREGTGDFVKVLDFGIAKVQLEASSDQPLTQMGMVFGTPEYMSPEQAKGLDVDARSDLYALGIILYELLAGASPFHHEDLVAMLARQITMEPPPLPERVSAGLAELVMKLLRKDPDGRPESAIEVRDRLDALIAAAPPVSGLLPIQTPAPNSETPAGTVLAPRERAALATEKTALSLPLFARDPRRTLQAWFSRLGLQRRVAVGRYAVPLGVLVGLSSLLVVALALAATLVAVDGPRGAGALSGTAAAAAPPEPDRVAISAAAEKGDPAALATLAARPAEKRSAPEWHALGHGNVLSGNFKAALAAYAEGLARYPELSKDGVVVGDVRRAADRADVGVQALDLAARALGPDGVDLLYDVAEKGKGANPSSSAQKARALLEEEWVRSHASPALRLVFSLQSALKRSKCSEVKRLLPEAVAQADERSVSLLGRLLERRGCGFLSLGDCYSCLRSGIELNRAIEAANGRPKPGFSGGASPVSTDRPGSQRH